MCVCALHELGRGSLVVLARTVVPNPLNAGKLFHRFVTLPGHVQPGAHLCAFLCRARSSVSYHTVVFFSITMPDEFA